MVNVIRHQYLAILWGILVLILCDLPASELPAVPVFAGFDKLVHTGLFFVLTVLMLQGAISQFKHRAYRFSVLFIISFIAIGLGGLVELLQWKVFTSRSGDLWDFFCDSVGVAMAVFSFLFLYKPYRLRVSDRA